MLVVGFYQRIVPFLLYGFQFNNWFNNPSIGKILSWWRGAGVGVPRTTGIKTLNRSSWIMAMMRHTQNRRLFRRPGGVYLNDENPKRAEKFPCDNPEREIWVAGEKGVTRGWRDLNDKNPIKRYDECPKIQTNGPSNSSLVPFVSEMTFGEFPPSCYLITPLEGFEDLFSLLGPSGTL